MDCIDSYIKEFGPCDGSAVVEYPALSGSGECYARCERHYQMYVERVQPRIDEVRERYPDSPIPPLWFDPTYAGECWEEDY
jgi:hypothetical protein